VKEEILKFNNELETPERLDKFLVMCLPDYSRSRLQGLIRDGMVTVNQKPVVKSGQLIEKEDLIELRIPPVVSVGIIPENIPLNMVYEDQNLMVVNKPAGMVVHPAAGHWEGTLVHAALAHAPEMEGIGGEHRPGVVHRLDKDTSGLILLAKNDRTHRWLQDQFRLRKVRKVYLALVDGKPPTNVGRVEAPIGRDPAHRKQMAIVRKEKGRDAITEYKILEVFREHTLLEAHPFTGRTHQIRIHLAFIGCPIVGDTLYGHRHPSLEIPRHFLHAARISIVLPGENELREFEAPLPSELNIVLELLRNSK
jgi:23S rRNA pseudouridine1911/1915/1917 synthase